MYPGGDEPDFFWLCFYVCIIVMFIIIAAILNSAQLPGSGATENDIQKVAEKYAILRARLKETIPSPDLLNISEIRVTNANIEYAALSGDRQAVREGEVDENYPLCSRVYEPRRLEDGSLTCHVPKWEECSPTAKLFFPPSSGAIIVNNRVLPQKALCIPPGMPDTVNYHFYTLVASPLHNSNTLGWTKIAKFPQYPDLEKNPMLVDRKGGGIKLRYSPDMDLYETLSDGRGPRYVRTCPRNYFAPLEFPGSCIKDPCFTDMHLGGQTAARGYVQEAPHDLGRCDCGDPNITRLELGKLIREGKMEI
jgi:hypothetical protein